MECSLCEDRGIILKDDVALPCCCVKRQAIKRLIRESQIPKNLLKCSLERFEHRYYAPDSFDHGVSYVKLARLAHQAASLFVRKFALDQNTDGLMFTGPVGSGKTYLACSIANDLLSNGHMVLFLVVPDFLDQIRSTFSDPAARGQDVFTEYDLVDSARRVPLLILDDLGAHNYTEWTKNRLYSIINYRLNHQLPLIVTTNINPEDLEEYLGERTTSRLLEMCRPYRLMVDLDIRAIQRKEKDS